ncbi:MAG: hypothetical protein M0Z58_03695 [Nitrospiraceae bacterium]|nr:hypothetical protein [Nitrospiraceae bacterium]
MDDLAKELFQKGEELLSRGEGLAALASFEKSLNIGNSDPLCRSYVALLSATERGELRRAINISEELLKSSPAEPLLYLHLGKLYLLNGRKTEAVGILREGMARRWMPEAEGLLESMGLRKKPVFPFLSRGNRLNKFAGLLFSRLGLR